MTASYFFNKITSVKQWCVFTHITCIFFSTSIFAQPTTNTTNETSSYKTVVTQRVNKILDKVGITDSSKYYTVQQIIYNQYNSINTLQNEFNTKVKAIKKDTTIAKEIATAKIETVEKERTQVIQPLHNNFLASLSKWLSNEQIVTVKDGMTYNKLSVTYNAYIAMIPTLTAEQKDKILAYLTEAREYAMDAESSEKKTEWFGKYKGKINNYLSAQGYDIKKEEKGWQERIKQQNADKKSQVQQ